MGGVGLNVKKGGTSFISDQFINECFPIMMAFSFLYICEYGISCNECLANEAPSDILEIINKKHHFILGEI